VAAAAGVVDEGGPADGEHGHPDGAGERQAPL
jgi:hypothetical protein